MMAVLATLKSALARPKPPVRVAVSLIALLSYGTTGFLYFELPAKPELGWGDALWWCVVTLTTVGYGDFFPSSAGGRFFVAVPFMCTGIGLLGYMLSFAATKMAETKTREARGMATLSLTEHVVILNYPSEGRVASVIEELTHAASFGADVTVVVVDDELDELPAPLAARGVRFVRGNPSSDETLTRASIDGARLALVLAKDRADVSSDHRNLAITVAIEARQKKVHSVVQCVDPGTAPLLRKAGCDSVVCTTQLDASFMSSEAVSPGLKAVVDDLVTSHGGQQLYVTPIEVASASTYGAVVAAAAARGHLAVGVMSAGDSRMNPPPSHQVKPGDRVVTIGPAKLGALKLG
ncbi:MAG: NAD-binding protein [Polyangiaceae bacterium]|nr:NAD-binding protein [Polyangiaceae bacterium]